MRTVWNGTLERQAAEAVRRDPPPLEPKGDPSNRAGVVLAFLVEHADSTIPEIAMGVGCSVAEVNSVLYRLKADGVVRHGRRQVQHRPGRPSRGYVVVEGA